MRIGWVIFAGHQLESGAGINIIKNIGSTWGSWRTWRNCLTDNTICHDHAQCQNLLESGFEQRCNFYVPRSFYQTLTNAVGVKAYDGNFDKPIDNIEDIIAMHLCASGNDLVLLLGGDFGTPTIADEAQRQRTVDRHGLLRGAALSWPKVQWVAIDHAMELAPAYQNLSNFTSDKMKNVLELLSRTE